MYVDPTPTSTLSTTQAPDLTGLYRIFFLLVQTVLFSPKSVATLLSNQRMEERLMQRWIDGLCPPQPLVLSLFWKPSRGQSVTNYKAHLMTCNELRQ